MSAVNRYILSKRMKKSLTTREIGLFCKICGAPIQIGEGIESKQQSKGQIKLYHVVCYENSFIETED